MSTLPDPEILSKLERLDLAARRVVEGFLAGRHRSPYRGFSVEFARHRQYVPGDDTRHIDWKAWAKTERLYLKQYHQETNLTASILVDTSRSMAYRGRFLSKLDRARLAAASLLFLILDQRDSAAVHRFADHLEEVTPQTSHPAAFYDCCERLLALEAAGEGAAGPALEELAGRLSRRGVVIVISDLFAEPAETLRAVRRLAFNGHDVLALQVLDRDEREFPLRGPCLFESLEGSGTVRADARRLRAGYLRALGKFQEHLHRGFRAAGADLLTTDTSEPLDAALAAYLAARAGRGL